MSASLHKINISSDEILYLPNNEAAEQNLIGSILLDNDILEKISDFIHCDHFYITLHNLIFKTIVSLRDQGRVADPITLHAALCENTIYKNAKGQSYVMQLVEDVFQIGAAEDHAKIIYDAFLRRNLITIGKKIVSHAKESSVESDAKIQIEEAEKNLYELATKGEISSGFKEFSDVISTAVDSAEKAFKRDGDLIGITSGLTDLDAKLGGLHPSDLLILAGRPSMGKTALATNIAYNAAKRYLKNKEEGACVAFFSLEMSAEQLASRILSSESMLSSDSIRRGKLDYDQFQKFIETSRTIKDAPLHIEDTPALSITAVRNRCRRLKRQKGLGLVVVDYLQLLTHDSGGKSDGRVQEISEITRGLKALAKELHVPVLALSQLSRAVEQRDDKRPQLSDLRESGSIEQDADVVMFVYREAYYLNRKQPEAGSPKFEEWQRKSTTMHNKAEVILAKQRHGPIGTVNLFFDEKHTKFGNLMR